MFPDVSDFVAKSIEQSRIIPGVCYLPGVLCNQRAWDFRKPPRWVSKNGRSNQGSPDLTMKPAPDHAGSIAGDPTWWLSVAISLKEKLDIVSRICYGWAHDEFQFSSRVDASWCHHMRPNLNRTISIGHGLPFFPCNVEFWTHSLGPDLTRWTLEPGLAQRKASREVGRTGQPPKALRCLGKLEGNLLLLDMHGADYLFCWVLAHCRESIDYLFSPNMSQVLLVADALIVAKTFFFSENWLGGSPGNVAFISMNKDLMVILKP